MRNIALFCSFILILTSCAKKATPEEDQKPLVSVKVSPVKVGSIESSIKLNGKTIYQKKNSIVSPISGYVLKIPIKFGEYVQKNNLLFEIQTKENRALENTNSGNIGIIKVQASTSGTINVLNITETGGYIMEGTPLCTIVENKDVRVQVNVPFEYNALIKKGSKCTLYLADNTSFEGTIYQILPNIDEANQTQQVLIKPNTTRQLPENLNLTVKIMKVKHNQSLLVPRNAVMTNETQSKFWIMKIAKDSLAVKVPIIKGIANDSLVEILSSGLNTNDLVINEGAYGLTDSTVVRIVK